jgi:hypothetical protein
MFRFGTLQLCQVGLNWLAITYGTARMPFVQINSRIDLTVTARRTHTHYQFTYTPMVIKHGLIENHPLEVPIDRECPSAM